MKARRPVKGSKPAAKSPYRILIALAVVGAFGIFYVWNSVFLAPKSRQRADVQDKIAAAKQQEQDLRGQLGQLKKLAADTQGREAELARLGRLVPADSDVAGTILALNETANQAQVAWSSFVPMPPAPAATGAPATLGVGMKVAGSFAQVFDYLARLERLDRLVVVDSIALSGGPLPNGQMRIDADIKARMFAVGTGAGVPAAVAARPPAPADDPAEITAPALTKAGG